MLAQGNPEAPLLITADQAAAMLSISRSKFYEMNSSGHFGPAAIKLGRCSRWNRNELIEWVEAGSPNRNKWKNIKRGA